MKASHLLLLISVANSFVFGCSGSDETIPVSQRETTANPVMEVPLASMPLENDPQVEMPASQPEARETDVAVERIAVDITIQFVWGTAEGTALEAPLFAGSESDLQGKGVWVAYTKDGDLLRPNLIVGADTMIAEVDANALHSLSLVIDSNGPAGRERFERVLFRKDMALGMQEPRPGNTYAILINHAFLEIGEGQDVAGPEGMDAAALRRTRGLALAYAAQSDAYSRSVMPTFGVEAEFAAPRIVVAAEEWMEIEAEKEAPSGGGLFGFDLESKMDGEQEGSTMKQFTTYTIDVLRDAIETTGGDGVAFQTARSLRNDILEGEVIYAATKGSRRVLTASIVFSEMMKNRETYGTDNQVLTVDAQHPEILDQCTDLFPEAKARIANFLAESPDWIVQIPQKPVLFIRDNVPAYGMYAWFMVHPETGRMVGMLPNGLHGATDELSAIREVLRKNAVDRLPDEARARIQQMTGNQGGLHSFFGAVAGMYAASAGVLDGIGITMEDPAIAALGPEELLAFLSQHSLDHCRDFLEQNRDIYGFSARVGYWGGVMGLLGNLGGGDVARDVATEAWNDIQEAALDDIGRATLGAGRDSVVGAAEEHAERARDFQRYVADAEDAYGFQSEVPSSDFLEAIGPALDDLAENPGGV
jgi:hypothetical protein